jgi:rhamnogalacturonan endolyase
MTDHQYGFWSHDAMGPRGTAPAVARVTIDPKSNAGSRAEVSVKGISKDRKMGTGPGANAQGQFPADVEIRYALGRGDAGVYTYCVFEHQPEYPASAIGEARFCAKLNAFFDWMSVAPTRNKHYPATLVEGDKYVYTVNQWENRAFGWSSTTEHVGFWVINPSMEYMSGGPTKIEFQGHRDTNRVAAPCVLNYWRSSHYGGASVDVVAGEHWTKVIGLFFIYANAGADAQAMYEDARAQQKKQAAAWPFDWVKGVDYPGRDGRSTVTGTMVLDDAAAQSARFTRLRVGLTAAEWQTNPAGPNNATRTIGWQQDAKNYQFWVDAGEDGRFTLPNIRPGTYVLRAMADGVLGEFAKADVVVPAGKPLDLGKLKWQPVRRGRQVWDIGIPNRTAAEFFKAESYWEPELPLEYAKLFPNDVNYVIGKSRSRGQPPSRVPRRHARARARRAQRGTQSVCSRLARKSVCGLRASSPASAFVRPQALPGCRHCPHCPDTRSRQPRSPTRASRPR